MEARVRYRLQSGDVRIPKSDFSPDNHPYFAMSNSVAPLVP